MSTIKTFWATLFIKKSKKNLLIQIVLCISCLFLGFLAISQYRSLQKTPEEKFVQDKSLSELSDDYITLYNKYTALKTRNEQLIDSLSKREAVRNDVSKSEQLMLDELVLIQRTAGFLEDSGGGIEVLITPDETISVTSNRLLQLVNEIKASEGLAISINGQRIVAMTEIRDTYSGFSVNGVIFPYDRPITILARGNGIDLYNALNMVGGVLDKLEEAHVDVSVDIKDYLTVPALGVTQQQSMAISADMIPKLITADAENSADTNSSAHS